MTYDSCDRDQDRRVLEAWDSIYITGCSGFYNLLSNIRNKTQLSFSCYAHNNEVSYVNNMLKLAHVFFWSEGQLNGDCHPHRNLSNGCHAEDEARRKIRSKGMAVVAYARLGRGLVLSELRSSRSPLCLFGPFSPSTTDTSRANASFRQSLISRMIKYRSLKGGCCCWRWQRDNCRAMVSSRV